MEKIFKEGDRVFHYHYGWGSVIITGEVVVEKFSVCVNFDNTEKNWFTFDGREYYNEKPSLSFTEYTLEGFSQERPEPLPKKGDIVWVRDDEDEEWIIAYFLFESDRLYYTTCANPFKDRHSNVNWKYLRTTNPYANEQ